MSEITSVALVMTPDILNEDEKMIDASKFWNHRFDSGYVIWNESDVDEDDFIDSED